MDQQRNELIKNLTNLAVKYDAQVEHGKDDSLTARISKGDATVRLKLTENQPNTDYYNIEISVYFDEVEYWHRFSEWPYSEAKECTTIIDTAIKNVLSSNFQIKDRKFLKIFRNTYMIIPHKSGTIDLLEIQQKNHNLNIMQFINRTVVLNGKEYDMIYQYADEFQDVYISGLMSLMHKNEKMSTDEVKGEFNDILDDIRHKRVEVVKISFLGMQYCFPALHNGAAWNNYPNSTPFLWSIFKKVGKKESLGYLSLG